MDVPEPKELTQCPYHDEELNRDSYLSPAFSSHRVYSSWAANAWRQMAIALTVMTEVTFYVVGKPAAVFQTAAEQNPSHRCQNS